METLKKFVETTFKSKNGFCHRPMIVCNDGFNMSVQGSSFHYCSPRLTQSWYNSMEIGFPSEVEELIMEYVEDKDNPTETVYGYVPCELIQKVIDKHKGIDVEATFNK